MKEIIKELAGWLLYIVLIIALTWCCGHLCRTENGSQWFFYGNYAVR